MYRRRRFTNYISDVLLWTPTYGRAKAGWPARTYIQQLCEDTECSPEDLPEAMNDREKWRERVRDICASGTSWWWWYIYRIWHQIPNNGLYAIKPNQIPPVFLVITSSFTLLELYRCFKQICLEMISIRLTVFRKTATQKIVLFCLVWFGFMAYQPL